MQDLFSLAELIGLLARGKREPAKTPSWKPLVGGYLFGFVGAALAAKLASKLEIGDQSGYVLIVVAGVAGFVAFLKGWRRVVG